MFLTISQGILIHILGVNPVGELKYCNIPYIRNKCNIIMSLILPKAIF